MLADFVLLHMHIGQRISSAGSARHLLHSATQYIYILYTFCVNRTQILNRSIL